MGKGERERKMARYHEYAWGEKNALSQKILYTHIVNSLTGSKVILDVGCGNGGIANDLLEKGYQVYGIDASRSGIQIANSRIKERKKKHFFVCDIDSGKLPQELHDVVFDTVISTEVIEHVYSPTDYICFLKKVFENNGGHGTVILSTPYHGYMKNLVLALTGRLDRHFTALWEGGHIKFWSRKTLSILLRKNGFKIKKFIGCGRFPYVWKSMIVIAEI